MECEGAYYFRARADKSKFLKIMNQRQRVVLVVSAALIAMMLIYPPFQIMGRGMGYSWIFSPPHDVATINVGQLLVQWVAVGLIGGIVFLLSKESKASAISSTGTVKASGTFIPDSVFTGILFTLRLIRGFAGFIAGWQIVGLLPILSWIANYNPAADIENITTIIVMKSLSALLCFSVFFGLRSVINKLHLKRHGVQHPALVKRWGL